MGSSYNLNATFHLGVLENLAGQHSRALGNFEKILKATEGNEDKVELYQSSILNIARIYYEKKKYTEAISFYGRIPRHSDYWLDAVWETSWAFFFLQKFNNTLGQIHTLHSPFFKNRFYPETFILQAITFLRLCRFNFVKDSMKFFKDRYRPVFKDVKRLLGRYKGDPRGLFKLVDQYKRSLDLTKFRETEEIIKKLTLVDSYKGAGDTIRFSNREIDALKNYSGNWLSSGLSASLTDFLKGKKSTSVASAGRDMYRLTVGYYSQLLELSNQTKLIVAEMQLGKLASLREKISANKAQSKIEFIGGLQQLNINQSLEYWPFEEEYWEDELGFYVYNIGSMCAKEKGPSK